MVGEFCSEQGQLSALTPFSLSHPHVITVACKKDASNSVKSADGRLQLNMHVSYAHVTLNKMTL